MLSNWTPADATSWRQWLNRPTGIKWLEHVRANLPKVKALTKESAWIDAVRKQGAEDLLEFQISLIESSEMPKNEETEFVRFDKEGD